ncbi:MAG TPA: MFS transporter [Verrucomicrobiales bacterium]|nr:MFS transporter [Verrucomicrobiales bacterium]
MPNTGRPREKDPIYERWRWQIFGVTWLAYAGLYLTRKGFSVAKVAIGPDTLIGLSKGQMAAIDTAYNVAYALGQFVFGIGGDRLGTRRVILAGMLVSSLAGAAMGFSSTALMFGIFFGIQGLVQATGWAPLTKNVSHFFSRGERGTIMGLWCTNYALGGFLATNFAGTMGDAFGWRYAFWVPACVLPLIWLLFLLFQRDRPEDVGLPSIEDYHGEPQTVLDKNETPEEEPAGSWKVVWEVISHPVVLLLGAVYFCLKPIRYLFLFWGAQYMHEKLGTGLAGSALISSAFELGGPVGALVGGWISDRVFGSRRVPVCVISLLALGGLIFFFDDLPANMWIIGGCFALMGAFTYAADSLVTGTAAVDFGSKKGASTSAGLINGFGSIGQIIGAALPGIVPAAWDWSNIFAVLAVAALFAALLMFPKWNALPDPAPEAAR